MRQCKNCGKDYEPRTIKQEDCSEVCLSNRFDTFTKKTKALARILAGTLGYRSMSEVRFAAQLHNAKIKFNYEAERLEYRYNVQHYTVDFVLTHTKNPNILLEYKGKLDGPTRKKMIAVKTCNPDVDLRLVFERPQNFLYRGSKMRYFEWAERHGFVWYDAKDIKKIKQDLSKTLPKGVKKIK